jgi:large subunit ribosomal protein L23
MKVLFDVVKSPCLTEKGNYLQETQGKVVFAVDPKANKIEIKNAVERLFKVKVAKVATTNMIGKEKRVGSRSAGKTSNWKKAYITLAEGKINFLDEL